MYNGIINLSLYICQMRDFTKYEVWKLGTDFTVQIYYITKSFPDEEKFGIVSQMRRAAVSIPSNIAEGSSRSTEKEFKRFIEISVGSCFELKTQLMIASRLGYQFSINVNDLLIKLDSIIKQLIALRGTLK